MIKTNDIKNKFADYISVDKPVIFAVGVRRTIGCLIPD